MFYSYFSIFLYVIYLVEISTTTVNSFYSWVLKSASPHYKLNLLLIIDFVDYNSDSSYMLPLLEYLRYVDINPIGRICNT